MTHVGEHWDRNVARHALSLARAALADTWRCRHVQMPKYMDRNYAFWRRVGLERVLRCRAAVRVTEARVAAVMEARECAPLRMAAE
jgi:hypothetical protein